MKTGIISVIVCLVVLGAAIGFMNFRAQDAGERIETANEEQSVNVSNVDVQEQTAAVEYANEETPSEEISVETETTQVEQTNYPARTDDGNLVIGSENAPVTIIEFSSLSCSHCASFHTNTLSDLKKDYVDTGKLQIIFSDFPTNKPAMDASKLLRCVATNERYDFMNLLFEQQLQWAMPSMDHRQKLVQYAALLGVSNEKANACMDDTNVENQIIANLQAANTDYGVSSTPTFVIKPGDKVLVGARPYGDFSTEIEALTQ